MKNSRNEILSKQHPTGNLMSNTKRFNTVDSKEAREELPRDNKGSTVRLITGKNILHPIITTIVKKTHHNKPTQAAEENYIIKKKMEEYNASIGVKSDNKNKRHEYNVMANLRTQAQRIDSLLVKRKSIVELVSLKEQTANATKFLQFNAKISCKNNPIPFKMNIRVKKGLNNSRLNFSFHTDRPDSQNCEKQLILTRKVLVFTLIDKESKEVTFKHNWIYISLETQNECLIKFTCSFGKGI